MDTKEIIQTNINSRLISKATKLEGGAVQDVVGSVSYELANIIDTRIDIILDNAFITTCDEQYLKIRGEELGIVQKETEDIEEYRARILEYLKDGAVNSNIASYIKWAKSVNGVDRVMVKDAFSAGAGKVKVYISAVDFEDVSEDLISVVQNKIKKEQIINAQVEVLPLEYYPVDITATVAPYSGVDMEDIEIDFEQRVKRYFKSLTGVVSYLYISNILFDTELISDVSEYYLNGLESSIILNEFQIPKINSITLRELESEE